MNTPHTKLMATGMLLLSLGIALHAAAPEYEIGGPLAGLKLPLFQGQHGEKPGYPGCIPELIAQGKEVKDMGNEYKEWDAQGQTPEVELYPGAVEHWRAYYFKYVTVRSFFDRQSQVKNFVAPEIPGAQSAESYAAPVYWVPRHDPVRDTGKKLAPVPVVRMKVKSPIFKLDLGELPASLYAVRVIGAVPTTELKPFRKPIFLRMKVNDGLKGEVSEYKRRIGYCDEFYSVGEFYFHAPEKRAYTAELWMDEGSETDLLVHNLSLDDVLAGAERQAIKQKGTLPDAAPKPTASKYSAEERLARDAAIWNYLPPINHQGTGNPWRQASIQAIFPDGIVFGAGNLTRPEIAKKHGQWAAPYDLVKRGVFTDQRELWNVFIANSNGNLKYTLADLRANKPLPDPFPFKDDGAGLYYVNPADPAKGMVFAEIGTEVMNRIRNLPQMVKAGMDAWRSKGDADAARDGAIALASYAYLFPSIESATYLCNLTTDPAAYGRNMYNRRREAEAMFLEHYAQYLDMPSYYDGLFDYIKGNTELARSIGQFVPWVKTPEDVNKLIDVYLLQITAKRILRKHYLTGATKLADLAAIVGPCDTIKPWFDWLFARTFTYPLPEAGIQDLMITGNDREGAPYIGSTYYAQGGQSSAMVETLDRFKAAGILPAKYDLSDSALYPKPLAQCHWQIDITLGGADFPRIGDVGGPDKSPGMTLEGITPASISGWKLSGDPRFAWVLKNQKLQKDFTAEEWAKIEKAAAEVKRAPWLSLKSRQLYNWFGALEAGVEFDDPALRRAAYLRTGTGIGHNHADTLDLQYFILGLPMTVDGGQRPGYTAPGDSVRRVHNTVEMDGQNYCAQSWVSCLADGDGARYLRATAAPPPGCRLFQRAIALLDVDSSPATSYIFDVFRVSGGTEHVYSFHGPIADEITTTAKDMQSVPPVKAGAEPDSDQQYLRSFKNVSPREGSVATQLFVNARFAGTASAILETTWRYSREKGPGEQLMLGAKFDAKAPRRFTRLHLMDVAGARVYRADAFCYRWDYKYTPQMVRKVSAASNALESAFTAIHEPYTGEPFIAEKKWLQIAGNDTDARKAVAVELKLTNGQRDICFADGYPEKERSAGPLKVSGEFAFYSTDAQGLRCASLAGGRLLKAPEIELQTAAREYTGKVLQADYAKKQIRIDQPWPAACGGGIFEIFSPARMTSYTSASVQEEGSGSAITMTRGADYFRAQVEEVDEQTGVVQTQLQPSLGQMPGLDKDFTASNEARTKFWRADVLAGGSFQLKGAPVKKNDFAPDGAIRLWEYGEGDSVRQSTFAHLRRTGEKTYTLQANVDLTVALQGAALEISPDGKDWQPLTAKKEGDKVSSAISAAQLGKTGRVFIRTK